MEKFCEILIRILAICLIIVCLFLTCFSFVEFIPDLSGWFSIFVLFVTLLLDSGGLLLFLILWDLTR